MPMAIYNKGLGQMKEWWRKRKAKTRKARKSDDQYTIGDFIIDVLSWIPELILFPIRLIFWMIRGIGRLIGDMFDSLINF